MWLSLQLEDQVSKNLYPNFNSEFQKSIAMKFYFLVISAKKKKMAAMLCRRETKWNQNRAATKRRVTGNLHVSMPSGILM